MVTTGRDGLLLPSRLHRLSALLLSASISGLFWTVAFAIPARALDISFGATAFMVLGGTMHPCPVAGASVYVFGSARVSRHLGDPFLRCRHRSRGPWRLHAL